VLSPSSIKGNNPSARSEVAAPDASKEMTVLVVISNESMRIDELVVNGGGFI
jgi:hypothetical protein